MTLTKPVDPFYIRGFVTDFEEIGAEYRAMSARVMEALPCERALPYGSGPAEQLDLYFPHHPNSCPVHIFVHGGYWRAGSRELYAFVARTICDAGAIAAVVGYDLLPSSRMSRLVEQVRQSVRWVKNNITGHGGNPRALSISGHSAGAHLACLALTGSDADEKDGAPVISTALLVSGIYDLHPIAKSFLQAEIHLEENEMRTWSPLRTNYSTKTRIKIVVGENETAPFHSQARAFSSMLAASGVPSELAVAPGENHMTIVRSMGIGETLMAGLVANCIRDSIRQ